MTINVAETVRKLMGWCPQKGFDFADARREKHEQYDDKIHEKDSHTAKRITTGEKLIIDYLDFNIVGIAILLFSIVIAIFVLVVSAFFVPILRNFVLIIFSIGFFIVFFLLLCAKIKNAEITADSIIVNRPFQKSVVIPKDSILKTEVVKNYNHSLRWIFSLSIIIILAFSIKSIIDVSSLYFSGNYSLLDTISIVIMHIGLISAYILIYFTNKNKSPYRSALKITAKLKNEVSLYVYVDDPQGMKNTLGVSL